MDKVLSVVIPCFNSGAFITEALESIKSYPNKNIYDVIIVNDGSTDHHTLELLKTFEKEYHVIHQENKGPAAARNAGVKLSTSKYILFLDSDNKLRKEYIEIGIEKLDQHPDVGVVYGNPAFFGNTSRSEFKSYEFNTYSLLKYNYIDMCSVIRKEMWEDVGGLDEERVIMGHEDWEFWINASKKGWKFCHINKVLFDYRIRKDSLLEQAQDKKKYQMMLKYIYGKHIEYFLEHYNQLYNNVYYYEKDQQNPIRTFIKFFYNKYLNGKKTGLLN